ncbi:hypothetical protein NQD34_009189 [Periophthalmus magnuspinnatus]|nr:hypothetical protein NQD34_009189 [Periophthalmus magnuspinnatus]
MDTVILKHILSSQGAVDLEELECNIGDVEEIIESNDKLVVCSVSGTRKVVARSRVRLCRDEVCPGCGGLHLCRLLFLSGVCPFLQTRGCSFCHDLRSEYNMEVRREFGLEEMSRAELCLLLLQSNNTLLPQICHDYNNRSGCQGACQYLHVCERYLHRDCSCFRTHDFFAPQPLQLLQKKHIPEHLIKVLKSVYANKEALWLADKENGKSNSSFDISQENEFDKSNQDLTEDTPVDVAAYDSDASSTISTKQDESNLQVAERRRTRGGKRRRRHGQTKKTSAAAEELKNTGSARDPKAIAEKCEGYSDSSSSLRIAHSKDGGGVGVGWTRDAICMFFIRGQCKHGDSCVKAHDMMPYRWQIKQGAFWIPMHENETIEREYCDPQNTFSTTCLSVHFDRMKSGQNKVRRLSTVSSVVKPNYSYTTHWLWYWQDENGKWYKYSPNERELIGITSKYLEDEYLKNNKEVVRFVADSQLHELSFQDMTERNVILDTKRAVRRRPWFVSAAEVKKHRKSTTNITAASEYVDKMQISQKGPTNILPSAAQLATAASTANELLKYSIVPPFYLATPRVSFTATSETTSGLAAKSVTTVLSTNVTQRTNVQVTPPLMTATSTGSSTTNSRNTCSTTLTSPVSQSTFVPATLTNVFSTTASTPGFKSSEKVTTDLSRPPMPTTTSDAKSQKALGIS